MNKSNLLNPLRLARDRFRHNIGYSSGVGRKKLVVSESSSTPISVDLPLGSLIRVLNLYTEFLEVVAYLIS